MQRSASLPIIPLMRNPKFHPNGKMFMTTFLGVLRLWNLPAGPWLTAPLTHPESVGHATLSPDGRRILTTCQDYILRTWDVVTGQSQGAELLHRGQISGLAFTENGNLCTSGYRSLSILDLTQQKEVFALSGGVVVELAPRGGKGVMYDKTAQLFDSINNQLIGPPFPIPYQKTSYVQFSPDGNSIVYCADRNAWVVDTGTGKTIFDPIEHDGNILKASFSVDGRLLFTSGDNGVIRLWDARTGKALDVKFKQDGSFFEKVAFLADKNRLFAFQENPQRKGFIWEVTSGKLLGSFDVPGINGFIGPSEDGTTILWTGWTGNKTQAAMWDADTYQRIDDPMERRKRCIDPLIGEYRFPDQIERPGFGKALGFTPGGRAYIAQPQRGRYMVLDTATGLPLGPAIKPPGGPGLITFSRDGRSILTASGSHVLLWPVSDPQQGAADDLRLWAEVKTGMELDDAGEVQILSPAVWKERLRLLKERDVVSRQIGDTPAPPPYVHSTVQAAKITRRWLSDGGNFERRASGQWIERVKSERFIFEEVKSTREYVELVDKSRDLGARLYADKLLLRYPKEKDFRFFRKGRWEPNTEFEVAPLPREVKP
jgi:WD40 repeat protein